MNVVTCRSIDTTHINPNAGSEVRPMMSPLLDNGAYALLFGLLLRFLYRLIRPWIKTREEMATDVDKASNPGREIADDKAKTRRQIAKLFSMLVFACSVAFALLLLLALTLPQTLPRTPIVLLLTGGVGALCVIGALLMIFGLPAYNCVMDLDDRCRSLEDYNQKLEERLKEIELQGQTQNELLEEQFPRQQKLAFMEMWSVQKRDHDTDLMKQAKADVGRLAGLQR